MRIFLKSSAIIKVGSAIDHEVLWLKEHFDQQCYKWVDIRYMVFLESNYPGIQKVCLKSVGHWFLGHKMAKYKLRFEKLLQKSKWCDKLISYVSDDVKCAVAIALVIGGSQKREVAVDSESTLQKLTWECCKRYCDVKFDQPYYQRCMAAGIPFSVTSHFLDREREIFRRDYYLKYTYPHDQNRMT